MEDWLPINGNPQYAVSNLGNVKNRLTDKLLKAYPSRITRVRRVTQANLRNINMLICGYVIIPVPTVNGKRRQKFYIDELRHAYDLARVLLENNNPIIYIE